MNMKEVVQAVQAGMHEITPLPINNITGVSHDREERQWIVTVELLERKSIPDSMDLLGIYEVFLDEDGEPLEFRRMGGRKRGDVGEPTGL